MADASSVFTAIGGIGAAVGGISAAVAAKASLKAGRDATDALAGVFKPMVDVVLTQLPGDDQPVVARTVVLGALTPLGTEVVHPASNVILRFVLASGREGTSGLVPLLEAAAGPYHPAGPNVELVVGTPDGDWPPAGGDHLIATTEFTDVRHIATYAVVRHVDLHPSATPGAVSFRNLSDRKETRLSP
jgi:hypothetical protein